MGERFLEIERLGTLRDVKSSVTHACLLDVETITEKIAIRNGAPGRSCSPVFGQLRSKILAMLLPYFRSSTITRSATSVTMASDDG